MDYNKELEKYMALPYYEHIQENKNSKGEITFYTGYIEELGINATGNSKKELNTNLILKKRDYFLNCLQNDKEIELPEQMDEDDFNKAWVENTTDKVKNHVKEQKSLTENKSVGTIDLKKLLPKEQETSNEKTRNPITRAFNWLYSKFANNEDKIHE